MGRLLIIACQSFHCSKSYLWCNWADLQCRLLVHFASKSWMCLELPEISFQGPNPPHDKEQGSRLPD